MCSVACDKEHMRGKLKFRFNSKLLRGNFEWESVPQLHYSIPASSDDL